MLDTDNDSTVTAQDTVPAAPVRRRRAAGRPAGPPQEGAAAAAEAPATEAAVDAPQTEAASLAPRRRRVAANPEGEGAAPARRRRVKVVESADAAPAEDAASAEDAAPAERAVTEPAGSPAPAAAPEGVEQASAKPVRRRATRRTAPPEPVVDAPEPEQSAADSSSPLSPAEAHDALQQGQNVAPAEPAAPAAEPAAPAAEPAAQQAPTRRRRASRPAAAPEPVAAPPAAVFQPPEAAPAEDLHAAAPEPTPEPEFASEPEGTPEAAPAPALEQSRGRRRRATRAAAAPVAQAEGQGDDVIGAALRAAEELAEARKALLSDPFLTATARDQQLAALAGAIAGSADVAEDDEDEEPVAATEGAEEPAEGDEPEGEGEDADDEMADDDADGDRPSRRRRRRGGRRRRRGSARDDVEDADAEDTEETEPGEPGAAEGADAEPAEAEGGAESEGETDESGTMRRRRRRRRRGEGADSESSSSDEVTGIEGSTRMEAKRQRRKESRAAGRRRAPILSEAEFLARREAVDRKLVIRQSEDYTQLAVVEDNILVEHYVDKASATSLIGNIYLGRVQNVLPSMEAAFIDIGRGRNAVLYAGEVDWAAFGVTGENRKVENVLKSGQSVLVQVTKDPVGAKGSRLTSHISLPGRYIVYSPGGHLSGISRKLPDQERTRLRTILGSLISDDESVIVRTAAEGASEDELIRDVNRLKAQWEVIEKKAKQGSAPQALYSEPDLTLRIVRDLFTEDFGQLIVQGDGGADDAYDAISAYVGHVAPHLAERLVRFEAGEDGRDAFAQFKIDEQIAKALDRKVFLPSGGSLVIDRTEAMTVIDVNTGRFTGAGGNLEATVTSNNLEAAEEIVRQLRLRDLGGIIVIDFIDMVLPSNRELLLRRLVECLGRDRTRHQVAEVTSLGLVQLTRKRIGTGLAEAFTEPCEHCQGAGYVRFEEPVDSQAPSDGGERRAPRRRGRK